MNEINAIKKKKIAIVTRQLIVGGIEKALISMLELFPQNEFDLTLYVMARGGELEQCIPKNVEIKCLYGEEHTTKEKVLKLIKKGRILKAFQVGFYTALSLRAKPGIQQERKLEKILPEQDEEYDIAIAYHVPASFPIIYVANYLTAKKNSMDSFRC